MPKGIAIPLSVADIEKLLAISDGTKFNQIRNRAMLELMYATGVRVSELISLKVDHVNLQEGWILVLGKGGRERLVPFGTKAKDTLIRYMEMRAKRFSITEDTLFLNSRGCSLTRGGFWWQLRQMAKQVGIHGQVSPHQIRHSFATHLLNGGANLRVVQEALGHLNISVTQRYTHISLETMRRAYEKAHPRYA